MDGMDGIDGWMDGWMDGWIDPEKVCCQPLYLVGELIPKARSAKCDFEFDKLGPASKNAALVCFDTLQSCTGSFV